MSQAKVLQAIDNLTNGNLTDAKNGVKKISQQKLISHIARSYNLDQAIIIAAYLKEKISFETYCKLTNKPC